MTPASRRVLLAAATAGVLGLLVAIIVLVKQFSAVRAAIWAPTPVVAAAAAAVWRWVVEHRVSVEDRRGRPSGVFLMLLTGVGVDPACGFLSGLLGDALGVGEEVRQAARGVSWAPTLATLLAAGIGVVMQRRPSDEEAQS